MNTKRIPLHRRTEIQHRYETKESPSEIASRMSLTIEQVESVIREFDPDYRPSPSKGLLEFLQTRK